MAVKKIFKRIGDPAKLEIKLAPQEQIVFDTIPAKGIERGELVAALQKKADAGDLKTKQSVTSILGYYTKHLVDTKLVDIERIEEAPAAKAKPEPKAKVAAKEAA